VRYAYRITLGAFVLSVGCAAAAAAAGTGSRLGWWHFRTGFAILTWAAYGALLAAILGLVALIAGRSSKRTVVLGFLTIILGLLVAGLPWQMKQRAQQVPAIHDITTDTANPPGFVAILGLRHGAPNPAAYGGPSIAAQQQKAYPDLQPLILKAPPQEAFQIALETARKMEWQVVDSDELQGRIEATDTTFWFGFKDDVVVRVAPIDRGSRIDVRSVSRVGKSDVGKNASRIQDYLAKIRKALS
jgi:uncharacterized protein (DUF1499 family)